MFFFFLRSQIRDLGHFIQQNRTSEHHAKLTEQYQMANHSAKLTPMKVHHCWQSIVTNSPYKVSDFVWDPELPNALPKSFLGFRIRTTCTRRCITGNQKFICTTSSEHTRRCVRPNDAIHRASSAQRNTQNNFSFMR